MLSMTGHGIAREALGVAAVVVEVRALNHRFLDVRIRATGVLQDHVAALEELARQLLTRGRIEINARVEGRVGASVALDRTRAKAALAQLSELQRELGLDALPLSLLSLVPGLFVDDATVDSDALGKAAIAATRRACDALLGMRRAEGVALERDLRTRLARIRELTQQALAQSSEWSKAYRDRLSARLTALLADRAVALDPGRLEHELALLAERSDVSEELTRLSSHCDQFDNAMAQGEEPAGRRLEFLLQEMAREANTMGAKSADLRMTTCTIDIKTELERMREQVLNIL